MTHILALDPATHTGWAHSAGESGVWDLSIRRDESSGMRLIRLHNKLRDVFKTHGIDVIVFEAARHAAPKMQGALVVQAEIQGVIKSFGENYGIEYAGYSPATIKKHATGKGNASKGDMIKAAQEKFRDKFVIDDDEADALHLLDYARELLL